MEVCLERMDEPVHELVVFAFFKQDLKLWRIVTVRQFSKDLARRLVAFAKDFEHACSTVEPVIKAVPALLKKDMAAHLSC